MGNTKRVLHSDWPLEPTLPAEAACFKNSWLSFPSLKQNKSFFLAFTDLDFVPVHKKTKKKNSTGFPDIYFWVKRGNVKLKCFG